MPSTVRFLREFLRPRAGAVVVEETTYQRGGHPLPASVYRPREVRGEMPGWMTLHGLTHYGREHESLKRLARALAASGSVVLVPDLPEWRALRIAPATTVETIKAAVLELDSLDLTRPGRIGVIGFSFGATQALIAATDPVLRGRLAGVAAWGGYADMRTTARFAFLGEHGLDGRTFQAEPDPYGRWILAGNYLGLLSEYGPDSPLPGAFLGLARHAAQHKIMSWEPALDPVKAATRAGLDPSDQEAFDLIAPATDTPLTNAQRMDVDTLVGRMLDTAIEQEPLLDPAPYLDRVPVPVFLAHGRNDRLIPWTEMVRLRRALPRHQVERSGITALFAHSAGEKRRLGPALALETVRFLSLMRAMLRLI
jgi:pimeloyl-ACP methyl ester carboxylesterase